jgi:hypothetical protein
MAEAENETLARASVDDVCEAVRQAARAAAAAV